MHMSFFVMASTFLLALVWDVLLGDPPNRVHPVAAMGTVIRFFDQHAPPESKLLQFIYGMALVILGIALFSLPVLALMIFLKPYPWLAILVGSFCLKSVFSLRTLIRAGQQVADALRSSDIGKARRLVSWHLVSRDTSALDEGYVASATIESLAENLTDSIVAPMMAYLIGGLALAWAYRFVNTADTMIGYHSPRYEYLGKFAARLDDGLNFIPARVTALLIVLAAWMLRFDMRKSWQVMSFQHQRTESPNAGWSMSAAAGALGVVLEKIDHYRLEGGASLPSWKDIPRMNRLLILASLSWVVICIFFMDVIYGR